MGTISFTAATEALRSSLSLKGRAENTHRAYLADLKMFWLEMDLDQLDLDHLETLASRWLNSKRRIIAPKTTHRRLTTMKNLGLAFKLRILDDYRTPTPATPKPHPLPEGTEDLRKLLNVCYTTEHKVLITLTGLCGMRISEAREIDPTHFDFAAREVSVWGKGDKVRNIPLSDFAWSVLLPVLVDFMSTGRGKECLVKMGDRSARDLITRLGERAGISRAISSHDLRATFATEAYRNTKDIRAVQELLGHASAKQTELYILIDDGAKRAAASFMS